MNSRVFCIIFPLLALAASCRPRMFNTADTEARTRGVPVAGCQAGETVQSLVVEKVPSDLAQQVHLDGDLRSVEPSEEFQLRLDVCVGAGSPRLERVALIRLPRFRDVHYDRFAPSEEIHEEEGVRLPVNKWEVKGLEEALFEQDYSQLEIEIRPNWYQGLVLKGWGRGESGVVSMQNLMWQASKLAMIPMENKVLVGRLVPGDLVDPNHKCAQGTYRHTRLALGTATLEFELCSDFVGSQLEYKVLRLKVTDTADFLSPEERTVELTNPDDLVRVPENEVENDDFYGAPFRENRFYFDLNHHNACDTFYLNLKHAQFSGTSAVAGRTGGGWPGCAPGVVTSPRPDMRADGLLWTVKYKHVGSWNEEQEHPRVGHFFSGEED